MLTERVLFILSLVPPTSTEIKHDAVIRYEICVLRAICTDLFETSSFLCT